MILNTDLPPHLQQLAKDSLGPNLSGGTLLHDSNTLEVWHAFNDQIPPLHSLIVIRSEGPPLVGRSPSECAALFHPSDFSGLDQWLTVLRWCAPYYKVRSTLADLDSLDLTSREAVLEFWQPPYDLPEEGVLVRAWANLYDKLVRVELRYTGEHVQWFEEEVLQSIPFDLWFED